MTEYSKIAEGYFTTVAGTGTGVNSKFINLPFIPNTFEIWNKTRWGQTVADATPTPPENTPQYAIGFAEDAAGTARYTATTTSGEATVGNYNLTTGGFSFISAGTYNYGPTLTISSVSQAADAVVTTTTPHGLVVGDAVLIYGTTGMLQIAGVVYTVKTVGSTTTFAIEVNSSGFAAAATAGFAKKLLYPDLYIPEGSAIIAVSTGTTTTVTTAINHSFVVGQEVFFSISAPWGMTQLDSLGVLTRTGIPQQAYVTAVTANTITVNVNSVGFTAFAYPTSAASTTVTPAQVISAGDQNTGFSGYPPFTPPITIPGAYVANTRQGVLIGGVSDAGASNTALLVNAGDVIRWRAVFPDMIQTS